MKRSSLIVLLFITSFFAYTVNAQTRKNEFRLGAGVFSTNQIINTFSDVIVSTFLTGMEVEKGNSIGVWHAGYRYLFTDKWAVGGSFVFDYETDYVVENSANIVLEGKTGDLRRFNYTWAVEGDFKYIEREKFAFYSSAGLGVTLYLQTYQALNTLDKESDRKVHFNFQVTPIGVKYGSVWGGFFELGFGYKGIISIGLFCRL